RGNRFSLGLNRLQSFAGSDRRKLICKFEVARIRLVNGPEEPLKRLQRAVGGFLFFSCEVEFGLVFRDVDLSGGRVARDLLRKSGGRGGDGGAVGASCQCHECQRAEKGDNDRGRSTKRSGRSSFHSPPLWSATAVRAS